MAPVSSEANNLDRKNLRKASALLDEAGWEVGDDGMRRKDGKTLRMEMVHSRTDLLPVMNAYVENLRALGVDASFDIIDDPQLQERASPPVFDFDALPTVVINGGPEGLSGLEQAWSSTTKDNASRNRMGYADPAVHERAIAIVAEAMNLARRPTVAEMTTDRFLPPIAERRI